jgi:hypothetical protein
LDSLFPFCVIATGNFLCNLEKRHEGCRTWAGLAVPAAAVETPAHAVSETATKTRMHKAGASEPRMEEARVTKAEASEVWGNLIGKAAFAQMSSQRTPRWNAGAVKLVVVYPWAETASGGKAPDAATLPCLLTVTRQSCRSQPVAICQKHPSLTLGLEIPQVSVRQADCFVIPTDIEFPAGRTTDLESVGTLVAHLISPIRFRRSGLIWQ